MNAKSDGIWDDVLEIVKSLTDAGIRATADPRRVDPPCVLVVPESAEFETNCTGQGTTNWVLHVLAGQPGGMEAMRNLASMTAEVLTVNQRIEDVRLNSYSNDTGQPWPSFELRYRTVSSWT